MILKLVLGAAVVLAATLAAIFTDGSELGALQALRLLAPLLVVPLGVLLAGPGPAAVAELFRTAKSGGDGIARSSSAATLRAFRKALGLSALLGFLLIFTDMLKNLADASAVWRNFAWSLSPAVAAIVVWAAFGMPLTHAARRDSPAAERGIDVDEKPWSFGRWFLGITLSLAGLVSFVPMAFASWLLVDLPSFLILVFVPIGVALAGYRRRELREALTALHAASTHSVSLERAYASFRYLGAAFRVAACIGGSTGFVLMFRYWLDKTKVGPSVALLLISVFWCTLVYLVAVLPLEVAAERRLLRVGDRVQVK